MLLHVASDVFDTFLLSRHAWIVGSGEPPGTDVKWGGVRVAFDVALVKVWDARARVES